MLIYVWAVWLAQGLVLLAAGVALVAQPTIAQPLLPGLDAVNELELVELFAPLSMGLGALTLQVLRPSFVWMRTSLASAFFAAWLLALVLGVYSGVPPWLLGTAVFFALGNLVYVRRPNDAKTPTSARPIASAEAPMLGRFWAFQMLYYIGCGVLALGAPEWIVGHLFGAAADTTMATEVNVLRFAAAMYLTMAIVSHHAIGAQTDETWRGFCHAFLASQWACAIAMTVAVFESSARDLTCVVAVILPNVVLALVNTLSLFDRRWIRRFMDRVRGGLVMGWSLQAGMLLVVVYLTIFDAAPIIDGLSPAIPMGGERYLAKDSLRLLGPLALGLAGLSVLAALRRARRAQHDFARLFSVFGIVAAVVYALNGPVNAQTDQAAFTVLLPVLAGVAILTGVGNLLVWQFPDWRSADESYQGAADTKPRWVYRVCVWQAVFFGILAGVTLVAPEWLAMVILQTDPIEVHPLLARSMRSAAPFWAVMAATGAYAAASSAEWSWRGLCRWFAMWQSVYVVAFVYIFDSHLYQQSVLVLPTLIAGMAALNLAAARSRLRVDDLVGQPKPAGWLLSDAGSGVLMALRTVLRRARPYHRLGVGATGTFEFRGGEGLPDTAFFGARDEPLLCTVRFSNRRQADDATLDYRGCALRLSWPDESAPLDLLMRTGAFGHVYNAAQAVALRWAPRWLRTRWLRQSHAAREASIAGLRRAPDSYAQLRYHTQLVRLWRGAHDGPIESRRCRLRLIPYTGAESGLPDAVDEDAPWAIERRPDESRAPDYLRAELAERIAAGGVKMRLQAQISPGLAQSTPDIEDALAWYDATVDWPLPWIEVGVVSLDKSLPSSATEYLSFDPSLGAGVLATPLSPSWRDPRSLAATQDRVVHWVGEVRLRLYRWMGKRR